ncbi:MAG: hypothetical protein ACREDR_21045 [Blastocatellia bacterium]
MKHAASTGDLMTRLLLGFTVFVGILMSFNLSAGIVIAPVVAIFVIARALNVIIGRKRSSHVLPMTLWLIFGPVVICCLVSGLVEALRELFLALPGFVWLLILTLLIVLSFLYVRWHRWKSSKDHPAELQTNERQPLFPVHDGSEHKADSCAASESSKNSSTKD